MKVAIFFVLTAFVGIASCDLVCVEFKLAICYPKHPGDNPLCESKNELTDCVRNSARECEVESAPIVRELIANYVELCTEGTELNNLYKKHKKCVFHDAAMGNVACMRQIMIQVLGLGFPSQNREYQEKVLKVLCKYGDSGNKCVDDNINATCGAEAARFRRQLSDSSVRLSNQACDEVKAEANEIHYARQQHNDHSVDVMLPHTQYLSAVGPQAGSIHIAATIGPMENYIPKSGSTINVSHIIYMLLGTFVMKWFSPC